MSCQRRQRYAATLLFGCRRLMPLARRCLQAAASCFYFSPLIYDAAAPKAADYAASRGFSAMLRLPAMRVAKTR